MKTECTIRNFVEACILDAKPMDLFLYTLVGAMIIAYLYAAIREIL